MGPSDLAQVLRPLIRIEHPNLLVGLKTSDDAAVYKLNDEQAIIQTLDFFPPVVDDPYVYGGIAAANSLSDVYAMGGEPFLALNIAAFPEDLPKDILARIFQGGADKLAEAGAVLAGGHTVSDREPKYGLSVVGMVHPSSILTKGGARPGDRLALTKPLGTGAVTTALKGGVALPEDVDEAVRSMLRLNGPASRLVREFPVQACTDVTGFGLLGHGWEMALASEVGLVLYTDQVPLLPGAARYAGEGILPGGLGRNRYYLLADGWNGKPVVTWSEDVPREMLDLLFDPETSGGLLMAVPPAAVDPMRRRFAEENEPLWFIGEVVEGWGITVMSKE